MAGVLKLPWRRGSLALTALLLAQAVVLFGAAAPAHAVDCSGPLLSASSPVANTDFAWDPECSDARAQIWFAHLHDVACDDRQATVWFNVYDRLSNGSYTLVDKSATYIAPNGCGSNASLPTLRLNSPGSVGWKLEAKLYACSSLGWPHGCSSIYTRTFTG